MAGVPDQSPNTPENRLDEDEVILDGSDAERAHRRMEHNADRAARRASERMRKDEEGNDEFSNIGPV